MEQKVKFLKYIPEKEYKEAWDITAKYSDAAWFTHLSDWIDIERQWPVECYSFMVSINGVISGIIPLFLIRKKGFKYLRSAYKGWGGPAFIKDVSNDIRKQTYEHIDLIAKETKADWIEISLPLGISPVELIDNGFKIHEMKTSVINLQKDITEIYNNIDKKCRYEIRKSEKLGLNPIFRGAFSLDDIKKYHNIHLENYQRTNVPANPIWYFENLFKMKGNVVQFLFIEEEKEKVAAISIAMYKGHAIYLTGSSLDEALGKGLNHLLQWKVIQYLHGMGMKYYEMGEIEDSSEKAKTLGRFKESFGGELQTICNGIKVYKPLRYKIYCLLMKIKSWKK